MILTTTNSIEGHKIEDYLGIVTGVNMNYQRGKMTFSMKKWYEAVGEEVNTVKELAFQELKLNAQQLGANAVVGIRVELEVNSGTITAAVTGTAVKVAY